MKKSQLPPTQLYSYSATLFLRKILTIEISVNSACQEGSLNLPRQIVNPGFVWLGLERCHLPVYPLGESHHELFGSLITEKEKAIL